MNKLEYAKIAKLAQLGRHDISAFIQETLGIKDYQFSFGNFEGTEFVTLFTKCDSTMYVSFRGTQLSSADIVPHAVRCSTQTINMGKVHSGYLAKFNQVIPTLIRRLRSNGVKSIVFVGHSLGGAIAQLAYLYFSKRFAGKEVRCVTFGSCKPIKLLPSKPAKQKLIVDVQNYYLLKDYVGMFPFGYNVIAEPIVLNSDKAYSKDTVPVWGLGQALNSIFVTKRHCIDTYIKEIGVLDHEK